MLIDDECRAYWNISGNEPRESEEHWLEWWAPSVLNNGWHLKKAPIRAGHMYRMDAAGRKFRQVRGNNHGNEAGLRHIKNVYSRELHGLALMSVVMANT
ncbi:hypothetical protein IB223_16215 [Pseudoxanthomonas sp. PXM03]|jgi:hypothetical protein|uniref:hypothetical protein n=1 Tax=Pseudoxanthomonas sp. PXM03 TaxID=2769284 RepID=UPI00177FF3AE|nr:hypothetical protein [Pseudoxanthomonas sp. PXM03]MBD9437642.1 hypothetical protein [Pseudoxanthomonas sp. PXM03]